MTTAEIDAWLEAVVARHTRNMTPPEFLKAVRALSARYVERRSELVSRTPTDSAGKRAAFAGFFAPLHFLTTRGIVHGLGGGSLPLDSIVDLGCGTGAASAAWAAVCPTAPAVLGIDKQAWALDEASWNWNELGVNGRTRRGDLSVGLAPDERRRERSAAGTAVLLAWTTNELNGDDRERLLRLLLVRAAAGAAVLVIEPLSRAATPWWGDWSEAWLRAGGRADEWKLDDALPPALERLSRDAGFRRETLGARSIWSPGRSMSPC